MTSYPFLKMAAATAKYYFRFRICWCRCFQKVKVYQQTKFRSHISIDGWDITTSGLEKETSAILEFYFRFRSRPFRRNPESACKSASGCRISSKADHALRNFDVISIFKMAVVSHVVFAFGWWQTTHEVPFVVWTRFSSLVRWINSSGYIAMYRFWRFCLKLPIHPLFGEF